MGSKDRIDKKKDGELLSTVHVSEKATNRQCLLKILSNLRFFAHQGSAIRGHGDKTDSNYDQLLKFLIKIPLFNTTGCYFSK